MAGTCQEYSFSFLPVVSRYIKTHVVQTHMVKTLILSRILDDGNSILYSTRKIVTSLQSVQHKSSFFVFVFCFCFVLFCFLFLFGCLFVCLFVFVCFFLFLFLFLFLFCFVFATNALIHLFK